MATLASPTLFDSDLLQSLTQPSSPSDADTATENPRTGVKMSCEKVLARDWNLHDVDTLSPNYNNLSSQIQIDWDNSFSSDTSRPTIYTSSKADKGSFLPLRDASVFSEQLSNASSLAAQELYAVTQNSWLALKTLQDEWIANDKLLKAAGHGRIAYKAGYGPQDPEPEQVFQDKLESDLYGYKYKPGSANTGSQDPFDQGGFIPKGAKRIAYELEAAKGKRALDDSVLVMKEGQLLAPWGRKTWPAGIDAENPPVKSQRKRKAKEIDAEDPDRPGSSGSGTQLDDEAGYATSSKPATRFRGAKVPNTRETSEVPLQAPLLGRSPRPRAAGSRLNSAAPSRSSTPGIGLGGSPSPAKRRKATATSTGATNLSIVTNAGAAAHLSSQGKKEVFTDASLIEKIKAEGPLFLYPSDPVKAAEWGAKLLVAPNPLRSRSMFMKWDQWGVEGKNKRPRKKKAAANGASETQGQTQPQQQHVQQQQQRQQHRQQQQEQQQQQQLREQEEEGGQEGGEEEEQSSQPSTSNIPIPTIEYPSTHIGTMTPSPPEDGEDDEIGEHGDSLTPSPSLRRTAKKKR